MQQKNTENKRANIYILFRLKIKKSTF